MRQRGDQSARRDAGEHGVVVGGGVLLQSKATRQPMHRRTPPRQGNGDPADRLPGGVPLEDVTQLVGQRAAQDGLVEVREVLGQQHDRPQHARHGRLIEARRHTQLRRAAPPDVTRQLGQ
jgi:hypothetical protein